MRAKEFLLEGFKEVTKKYIDAGQSPANVDAAINTFKTLVNKNQVQGNQRNIDWWGKNKSFDEFKAFIDEKTLTPTDTQVKRAKVVGNSLTLQEDDDWLVVVPLDKAASCFHGKNTNWCTTKQGQTHYEQYFYDANVVLIYCIQKQTGNKWAIASYLDLITPNGYEHDVMFTDQDVDIPDFFDERDKKITEQEFIDDTGLDPDALIEAASNEMQAGGKIRTRLDDRKTISDQVSALMLPYKKGEKTGRDPRLEKLLLELAEPVTAMYYLERLTNNGKMRLDFESSGIPVPVVKLAASRESNIVSILTFLMDVPYNIKKYALRYQPSTLVQMVRDGDEITDELILVNKNNYSDPTRIRFLHKNELITPVVEKAIKKIAGGITELRNLGYEITRDDVNDAMMNSGDRPPIENSGISGNVLAYAEYGFWPSDEVIQKTADFFSITPDTVNERFIAAHFYKLIKRNEQRMEDYPALLGRLQSREQQESDVYERERLADEYARHKKNFDELKERVRLYKQGLSEYKKRFPESYERWKSTIS